MILQNYILRSLIRPFFIGFGFVTFLFSMELLLDLLDLFLGKGIGLWTVLQLFLHALGWMIALSIPCGVLVAVLMVFGRMSQDNEIIALRASGIHLFRLVLPALGLSTALATGMIIFNNFILPETNHRYAKLIREIKYSNPTAQIREGVIINDFQGYTIRINRLDDRTGAMEDVLILDASSQPESPRTILARRGVLEYNERSRRLALELEDGTIHEADARSKEAEYRVVGFEHQTLTIESGEDRLANAPERKRSDRELSVGAMRERIEDLRKERADHEEKIAQNLKTLDLPDLNALRAIEPTMLAPTGLAVLTAKVSAFFEKEPVASESREWTRDEENAIGLVRSQYRESANVDKQIQRFYVEIHKKFSIPVACIVFVLVGAPLGVLSKRGGFATGLFSAVFFVFYYLCLIGGEQLADRSLCPTWFAMWFPNILIGFLGLLLLRRAVLSGFSGSNSGEETV